MPFALEPGGGASATVWYYNEQEAIQICVDAPMRVSGALGKNYKSVREARRF
jgi:hypothetical protein